MNNSMEITFPLPVPDLIKSYSYEKQDEIKNYLNEIDDHHKKAYLIALNHLGSSFNIYRSNGFKDWLKERLEKERQQENV